MSNEKLNKLESLFSEVFNVIYGSDEWKKNQHFSETPKRLAKMYLNEIFRGVSKSNEVDEFDFTTFDKTTKTKQIVTIDQLSVKAFCAHHIAPFIGTCTISYIPDQKIFGLSKFQRILDKVCSEPTVQEELTEKYLNTIVKLINPLYVSVTMDCIHTCMLSRGIKLENARTITKLEYYSDKKV